VSVTGSRRWGTGEKRWVNMGPVRDYVEGKPFNEPALLKVVTDLCDTVARMFFRADFCDDEMHATARCKVLELVCGGRVDFANFSNERCFTFLYTTIRNTMGNYLKRKGNGVAVPHPLIPSRDSELSSSVEHDFDRESVRIHTRMDRVGIDAEVGRYSSLLWRAACFRAFEGGTA